MLPLCPKRRIKKLNVLAALCLCVCVIYLLANIPFFAEYFFARGITRFLSALINCITNPVSISLYEITAVLLIVLGIAFVAFEIVFLCRKKFVRALLWLYRLAVFALSVLLAFGLLYAPLYNRQSVNSALGLDVKSVTKDEIYTAAEYFIEKLNAASDVLERDSEGNIIAPLDFYGTAEVLNEEYDGINSSYFASYDVTPKSVAMSTAMSYLGITGIYFPFYAEANVNANILSYELPVTMAHEMAHAKGVASETEANVTAYVLCIRSDNVYLNYSGLMYAVANLVNNSGDNYFYLRSLINDEILTEYANASENYDKYEGWLDEVSSFFNNLFLKANGVSGGITSYGATTKSIVALYYSLVN